MRPPARIRSVRWSKRDDATVRLEYRNESRTVHGEAAQALLRIGLAGHLELGQPRQGSLVAFTRTPFGVVIGVRHDFTFKAGVVPNVCAAWRRAAGLTRTGQTVWARCHPHT